MKEALKFVLSRVIPGAYQSLAARRSRARNHRLEIEWGCVALAEKYITDWGATVRSGPFEGLQFPPATHTRHIVPKLVGSYELELHPMLEAVASSGYSEMIDVGCAQGYYAVGLARRVPAATVHAFDIDSWARRTVAEMAELNGAANVRVHDACDPAWLAAHLKPGSFILSDCEGYEDVLLDPERVPALRGADILVETHADRAPGVADRLTSRFGATHNVEVIRVEPRNPDRYPTLESYSTRERELAVSDVRPENQIWMWMTRRTRG